MYKMYKKKININRKNINAYKYFYHSLYHNIRISKNKECYKYLNLL